jgi:hypothetical protein
MSNNKPKDIAKVVKNESGADDVRVEQDGYVVTIACEDISHARELASLINQASWLTVGLQ